MPAEGMADYWAPVAKTNHMIMVFPQAKMCWDIWGEFGEDYNTLTGKQ